MKAYQIHIGDTDKHDKHFYDAMWDQLREEGRWQGEIWNRRKTGELYPEWLTISAIKDQQGLVRQFLGICTETSARKAAEERGFTWSYWEYQANFGIWDPKNQTWRTPLLEGLVK